MTKKQVLAMFRVDVLPHVIAKYGRDDRVAIREEWNNFTDMLCKDNDITANQYDSWTSPF